MCDIYDAVVTSNPATDRLMSKLLANPNELITEPVISTNETVDAQLRLALMKVLKMVRTPQYLFLLKTFTSSYSDNTQQNIKL